MCDQAIYAVMKASRGSGRFAPKILQKAILAFYKKHKLLPNGMVEDMQAVQLWSLKMGRALSRLVSRLNHHFFHDCNLARSFLGVASTVLAKGHPLSQTYAVGFQQQEREH